MRTEINKEIEAVSKAADPLKILASADTMKVLGVQRPLLQVRNIQHIQTQDTKYILTWGKLIIMNICTIYSKAVQINTTFTIYPSLIKRPLNTNWTPEASHVSFGLYIDCTNVIDSSNCEQPLTFGDTSSAHDSIL